MEQNKNILNLLQNLLQKLKQNLLKKLKQNNYISGIILVIFLVIIPLGIIINNDSKGALVDKDMVIKFFYLKKSCDAEKWWDANNCSKYRVIKIIKTNKKFDSLLNTEIQVHFTNNKSKSLFKDVENTNLFFFIFKGDMRIKANGEYIYYIKEGSKEPFKGKLNDL